LALSSAQAVTGTQDWWADGLEGWLHP